MLTEMEVLNLMPADLSKVQDITDSSFLRGIPNQTSAAGAKMTGVSSQVESQ